MSVDVPVSPALVKVPRVELVHTGTWEISTGTWTATTEDLRAAVSALECPAVRRPVIKLGHVDPRFDGQPAVGYVDGLTVTEDGRTLLGDFAGLPAWLADVLASAFPDRSVEGFYDFSCQLGHTHPFVLTAVALLGVEAPGIGTLQSLQDVARLYGVAAAPLPSLSAVPVAATFHHTTTREEPLMPAPVARQVAASVSIEDVRRAWYNSPAGQTQTAWIEEIRLDPLELIIVDDATNSRARVPVSFVPGKTGDEAFTFAAPVAVTLVYQDLTTPAPAPAPMPVAPPAADPASLTAAARYRTRADSRSGLAAAQTSQAQTTGTATADSTADEPTEDAPAALTLNIAQTTKACQLLGIPTDSDAATFLAALVEVLDEQAVAAGAAPTGSVLVEELTYNSLVSAARDRGTRASDDARQRREQLVAAAVSAGRIPPAGREAWLGILELDPKGERSLAALPAGVVPLASIGHASGEASSAEDTFYGELFPEARR